MRLVLFADGDVGESTMSFLLENYREDLAAIVFIPGEAHHIQERAASAGVMTIPFRETSQFLDDAKSISPFDLGVLAWWPKIIKMEVIGLAKHGYINFHPSLLPHNRGKHYNFWSLVEEKPFGVTLHLVDEGVDTGPILFQREIACDWTDTGASLVFKAKRTIKELFIEHYPSIRSLNWTATPQIINEGSTHFAKELEPASLLHLDERLSTRELLNKLRARTFAGYPACSFEDAGRHYEVRVSIEEITKDPK